MIVNNLTRNELLAKVYMRVLKEDQRDVSNGDIIHFGNYYKRNGILFSNTSFEREKFKIPTWDSLYGKYGKKYPFNYCGCIDE